MVTETSARDHPDHRLAQHLLVSAVDGVGGMPATADGSLFDLLTGKGF